MLEAILHSAVGGIITINEKGIIESVNPATLRLFGYSEGELIGRNVNILMGEPHRALHDGYIAHHLKTGERRIIGIGRDVEARRKDGSSIPVHLSVSAFEVDGRRYFAGIVHDLSTRSRLEGEVTRQSALFQSVFEHVPEPLIITDLERRILFANPAASRAFGYTADELNGRLTSLLYASPNDFERVGSVIGALKSEKAATPRAVAATFRRKSGEAFPGRLIPAVVRGAAGRPMGMLGLIRDLTEEQKQEEMRLRTQRLEAIGQLTGGVAHDFNNLLTIITGNLELLDDHVKDERGTDHLKRAQSASEAGARLTSRLLTFARRRRLEPMVVDLNEQVQSMSELLKRTLGDNIQLSARLAPDLWSVLIDPSEIENAILNLAINSRDAMPNGGKLVIETSNAVLDGEPTLSEPAVAPGNYVRMCVSDTGVGMTKEVLRRAFEPFFTTKPAGRGTGLGLSTIYGFIKQSNGNVAVYSELGKGTSVSLYLPQHAAEPVHVRNGVSAVPLKSVAGETILVVEDNPDVRAVAVARLERLGYKVIESGTAVDAIARLAAGLSVDAVFSDVMMPGGQSGYDLAQWLAASRPDLAIVLASGFAEDVMPVAATGGWPILRKPYTQAELAASLQTAMAAKRTLKSSGEPASG